MAKAKDKANIGTEEEPYFIEVGSMVHDMRTSLVRKVARIIWDPDHQPEFCVFLEVNAADLTGNGRELSELRAPDKEDLICPHCRKPMSQEEADNMGFCGDCWSLNYQGPDKEE